MNLRTSALLLLVALLGCQGEQDRHEHVRKPPAGKGDPSVTITIDLGEGDSRRIEDIPWHEGMTAADAMHWAAAQQKGPQFAIQGVGDLQMVDAIDGQRNEGGSPGDRNWIYRVNGKRADRSFAAYEVQPDDVVHWQFTVYNPDDD